ncbi:MAG: hypothetical protein IT464_03430 [Planctomycetes bacterium]|nr:hypothetical protein [Planctomycetota bacterium]
MNVELPLGEVVDKVAILVIKDQRIADEQKLKHVRAELATLQQAWQAAGHPALTGLADWLPLLEVNGRLWDVEDEIRECERAGQFGPRFIELARSVYHLNDKRAEHKRNISVALGSRLIEQKSYKPY